MSRLEVNCGVCPFVADAPHEFTVIDGEYWAANLRENDQTLLGTTFVTLKRHASELDQLTQEEDAEFIVIRNGLIGAIRRSFQPITFNVSCLKNDAFKAEPDDTPPEAAHVHWHVKPRYGTRPFEFAGDTFTDPLPGRYLSKFERHEPSRETALAIVDILKNNLVV